MCDLKTNLVFFCEQQKAYPRHIPDNNVILFSNLLGSKNLYELLVLLMHTQI